jgi:DNA-binding IclR family transcriptional regulator
VSIESDDVVKSVGRVFEVLELLDRTRLPLSATDIERKLGYPQSSTLALLKSMVKLGYLSFDRLERRYLPTMRVAFLGQWVETAFHGEGRLAALLDELSTTTTETINLSCQNDLHMQFTHVRLSTQSLILNVRPGTLAPLFRSAIGLTALSEQSDAAIRRMFERYDRRSRSRTEKVELDVVLKRVRRIRTLGYCAGYDLYLPGVGAIAWLLRAETGSHSIVLSIGGPSERIKAHEASIVRTVKAAIRKHLGT